MSGLLTALGELSRAASAAMQSAPVDLGLLAEWVLAELQDADPAHEVAIDVQPGLHVVGDERLLKQMLHALLENAWKFTRGRSGACIRVSGERVGGRLHVRIEDTGRGFDMQYAHKLFAPFQRLHHADEFEGTGIGLATVRKIVERYGGRVWIESAPGAGTTVHFTLG